MVDHVRAGRPGRPRHVRRRCRRASTATTPDCVGVGDRAEVLGPGIEVVPRDRHVGRGAERWPTSAPVTVRVRAVATARPARATASTVNGRPPGTATAKPSTTSRCSRRRPARRGRSARPCPALPLWATTLPAPSSRHHVEVVARGGSPVGSFSDQRAWPTPSSVDREGDHATLCEIVLGPETVGGDETVRRGRVRARCSRTAGLNVGSDPSVPVPATIAAAPNVEALHGDRAARRVVVAARPRRANRSVHCPAWPLPWLTKRDRERWPTRRARWSACSARR